MQERSARLMANITPDGRQMLGDLVSGLESLFDNEFDNIKSDKLKFNELEDIISGDDVF